MISWRGPRSPSRLVTSVDSASFSVASLMTAPRSSSHTIATGTAARRYDAIVAAKELGVFDPSGRLVEDLAEAAEHAHAVLETIPSADAPTNGYSALLIAPAVASDLGPPPEGAAPRWIVGDGSNA